MVQWSYNDHTHPGFVDSGVLWSFVAVCKISPSLLVKSLFCSYLM